MTMTSHRTLIHLLFFLCCLSTFSNSYVLLYHTENSPSVQYYDCIYYTRSKIQDNIQGVKYCHQLNESQPLQRDFNQSCHNDGQLWSFEKLSLLNISASDVLRWSSSLEQTDWYLKYLSNHSPDMNDKYICNCTNPSSFGKFCEYKFYGDSTSFNDAIIKQFQPLQDFSMASGKIHVGSQLHDNRPCYITLTCDSGLICLDWRHICDGKQQCMAGVDEDYCERLEFNECEDDEYRCANGMCIPDEYWLDGELDCMDWTDEKGTLINAGTGCFTKPSFVCDEHMCPYHQWSCGDGQCVNQETDRYKGVRNSEFGFCQNMRDVNYMCEAVTRESKSWWTIDNGYCLPYSLSYRILGLDSTVFTDQCTFSLKCALSNGLDKDCDCKSATECRSVVNSSCSDSSLIYPGSGALVTPYNHMLYRRDRDWTKKKPDQIGFQGGIKCIGYQFITNDRLVYGLGENFRHYDHRVLENMLCNMKEGIQGIRNYTGLYYDANCWNHSKTSNNRPYQVSFCQTRCISKYRVRDGIWDCFEYEEDRSINNSCPQIQRHRLQCSSSQLTCLLVGAVGNWGTDCINGRDEFDDESGTTPLINIACVQNTDPGCAYLRKYIQTSSETNTNQITIGDHSVFGDHSTVTISFRLYCNSFFDTKSAIDELPELCEKWTCSSDQYRCLSGQCISPEWLCDGEFIRLIISIDRFIFLLVFFLMGEWDCNDGSDEERLFIMDHLNKHNSKLKNLTELKQKCYQQYPTNNIPFSDICNLSFEYPCFRTGIDDVFNVSLNRPCINLTQIGDGKIDCLTGLDERNRLQCLYNGMLGFHVQFNDSVCVPYSRLCSGRYPWKSGANLAYDTVCFVHKSKFKNGTNSNCNTLKDVMCLNDTCIKNARCNGKKECSHGEDEYRCVPQNQSPMNYRSLKKVQVTPLHLPIYPSSIQLLENNHSSFLIQNNRNHLLHVALSSKFDDDITRVFGKDNSTNKTAYEIVRDNVENGTIRFEKDYLPFICNRGVAVKYFTGHTVCFCPSNFYGSQCEYHSDRITVVTHVQLNNYRSSFNQMNMIKVLTTFLFEDEIIDYYQFYVNLQTQNDQTSVKQQIYFVYPRLEKYVQLKKTNRSGTQFYNVRFEVFNLDSNEEIEIIGVWKYLIYFDFLPSFRLSKILRFPPPPTTSIIDPCSNNSCTQNGICQKIINSNDFSYFCSCKSGYFGIHCEHYENECNHYCAPKSICKPKYRGILTGNQQHPLCLCPISTFGARCYFKNDHCQRNPCLNGGTCIVTYNLINVNQYMCICTDLYEGNHCESLKGMVNINIMLSSNSTLQTNDIVAATVFYSDYDQETLRFIVRHQEVYSSLLSELKPIYIGKIDKYAPTTAVFKVYGPNYDQEEPKYYLLYFHPDQKDINITVDLTSENHCPLVETLWDLVQREDKLGSVENSTFNSTTSVFFYHHICRAKQNTSTSLTCFRDLNYLCICDIDHFRAECFGYNHSIDQCFLCLSNSYCLKGDLNDKSDFLCVCRRCYHGQMCQYSTELMSFTLDSLIVKDLQNNRQVSIGIYILIVLLIFFFGLFNNFNSFLTFIRPKPRQIGVGNYLLIISIVDQCSLLLLFFKVIHIILGSNGTLFYYTNLNLYSCKIVSYLLSVLTRITYWLTSFITIERLNLVLFPTSSTLKNPRRIFALSILVILCLFGMHTHELMYYTTIVDYSDISLNVTLCVTNYTQSSISTYNRVNVFVHYFIPFLIQIISITILIIQVACIRTRTRGNNQQTFFNLLMRQLKTQKEQYITPIIIVLSSLPQTILSFSYACIELKQSWQRYTLLATYFLSYLPQMLGFILFVLPSTTYSNEFRQTAIGQRVVRQQRAATTRQQNIETETRPTKWTVPTFASSRIETRK